MSVCVCTRSCVCVQGHHTGEDDRVSFCVCTGSSDVEMMSVLGCARS